MAGDCVVIFDLKVTKFEVLNEIADGGLGIVKVGDLPARVNDRPVISTPEKLTDLDEREGRMPSEEGRDQVTGVRDSGGPLPRKHHDPSRLVSVKDFVNDPLKGQGKVRDRVCAGRVVVSVLFDCFHNVLTNY